MNTRRRTTMVGIGAGGHAMALLEVIEQLRQYEVVGLTDADPKRRHRRLIGYPVLGPDGQLATLHRQGVRCAFLGVGAIDSEGTRRRARVFRALLEQGFEMPTLIHPQAVVSRRATLGHGTVVMAGAVVGPGVRVGDDVTVYSGSVIEHGAVIGPHTLLAPRVAIAGDVTIGEGVFVGIGAAVIQGVTIGDWATVGAGSVVVTPVAAGGRVAGSPARPVSRRSGRCAGDGVMTSKEAMA